MNRGINSTLRDDILFNYDGATRPPLAQIGTLFTDTFDRTTGLGSNYTVGGGATWTVNNGADLAVSGGAINFGRYARYTAYTTCLEQFSISISYNIGTVNASSTGLAIGIDSQNSFANLSVRALFVTDNTANSGKCFIYHGTTSKGSGTAIAINTNDLVTVTFARSYNVYTVTAVNHTTAGTATFSYTFATTDASGTGSPNNTGYFTMYAIGGSQTVSSWSVSSLAYKNVKTCMIGNSIMNGKFAPTNSTRFASLVNYGNSTDYHVNAGGGDTTAQVLARMPELLSINAENYLLMIMGNDKEYGVADATAQANYQSIVTQLKAIGARVVHLIDFARTSVDLSGVKTFIDTTYASDVRIDLYTRTVGVGTALNTNFDPGDGIHLNGAGHRDCADYIIEQGASYIPTLTESLNADTSALITRINVVTTWDIGYTRRDIYNTLITSLKGTMGADGVTSLWDSIEALWFYNIFEENGGLLNIKSSSYSLTKAGATPLPFAIDSYYAGNGSGYLTGGPNFGDGGSHIWTQDSASYFCGIQENTAVAVNEAGGLNASNLGFSFNPRDGSSRVAFRMNDNSNTSLTGVTTSAGHWLIKRTASNTVQVFQNGVQYGSDVTNNSSTLANISVDLFASNNNGSHAGMTNRNKYYDGFGNKNVVASSLKTIIDAFYANYQITI